MKQENKRIGLVIKQARKSRGMTQMKLAELIGVSYQQVQKYEKGVDNISVERLRQIGRALNAPMTLFFPSAAEKVAESTAPYGRITTDETALLRLFRRIKSRKARSAVLELLKSISGK